MNEEQLVHGILEILNDYAETHGTRRYGISPKELYNAFDLPEVAINNVIDELEDQGLIIVLRTLGCYFAGAAITPRGRLFFKSPPPTSPPPSILITGNQNVVGTTVHIQDAFNTSQSLAMEIDPEVKLILEQLLQSLADNSSSSTGPSHRFKELAGQLVGKLTTETAGNALYLLIQSLLLSRGINI